MKQRYRGDSNSAVISEDLSLDFSFFKIRCFVLNGLLWSGCWNCPRMLKYGHSWKLMSAGLSWLLWNATDHKNIHNKGDARTGQLYRTKRGNQWLSSEIKVIFNLTSTDSATELCFLKLMENFLDHEVTNIFMLSWSPSRPLSLFVASIAVWLNVNVG